MRGACIAVEVMVMVGGGSGPWPCWLIVLPLVVELPWSPPPFHFVLISLPPQFNVSMSTNLPFQRCAGVSRTFLFCSHTRGGKGAIRNDGNRSARAQVRTSRNECLFDAVYRDRANSLPPKTIRSWAVYTAWIHRWYELRFGALLVLYRTSRNRMSSIWV
jgi:hypothetical protein